MKIYALEPKLNPYMNKVQAVFPEDMNVFTGIPVRADNDYTEDIKKLQFRIELDVFDRKVGELKYVGTDFYNGPEFIREYGHMSNFYTISPKMKELLGQLNLPKHRFYPINLIIDKGKPELPYFILQIDATVNDYMDYSQSIFYAKDLNNGNIIHYTKGEIKDKLQKKKLLNQDLFPREKALYINQELDWVYMAPYYMISEKAKQLFEENNIIDIEMTPFYEAGRPENDLGYVKAYAGREIIINGRSTMDGLDINDFERKED